MKRENIKTADEFRELADKFVTLNSQITKLKTEEEAEKNALTLKYATLRKNVDDEAKDILKELKKYIKKESARKELFGKGKRSGESTLAVFGYRDDPPALKTLDKGGLAELAADLYAQGKTDYVLVSHDYAIDIAKVKDLLPGALAELGMRWVVDTKFFVEMKEKTITPRVAVQA